MMPKIQHSDMTDKTTIDPDIPMLTRGIEEIEPDSIANVSYWPNRSDSGTKARSGVVTSVKKQPDGRLRFLIDDEEYDREIEVTIGETTGESQVRSRKSDRWTTLGTPLRINVADDAESVDELMLQSIEETFEGRRESIVAAAEVKWNSSIVDWFDWSEKHA